MRFTVITNKQGHQPQHYCDFFPPGGTIGRAADNHLVLPDEAGAISLLQAWVEIAMNGECRVTNRDSVARVALNDIPLICGGTAALQDGDILAIDDYRLLVSQPLCATPALVPLSSDGAAATALSGSMAAAETTVAAGTPSAVPHQIWDDLLQEFALAEDDAKAKTGTSAGDADLLYAAPFQAVQPLPAEAQGFTLSSFAPLTPAIDRLFSQPDLSGQAGIFADTTPSALLSTPAQRACDMTQQDPLAWFGGPSSTAQTSRDALSGQRTAGFMPPEQAMHDALIDLQAHQLGMIAGVRAIITTLLHYFNPEQLLAEACRQQRIARFSLPGRRNAAGWQHFIQRYQQIAGEIDDDVHRLSGETFRPAYDRAVSHYKESQRRAER